MKIYVTTRMIEEFNLKDNEILKLLKKAFPYAEDIQSAKTLKDIKDVEEAIMEMADYLTIESGLKRKINDSHIMGYTTWAEAYEDMEWGIH